MKRKLINRYLEVKRIQAEYAARNRPELSEIYQEKASSFFGVIIDLGLAKPSDLFRMSHDAFCDAYEAELNKIEAEQLSEQLA